MVHIWRSGTASDRWVTPAPKEDTNPEGWSKRTVRKRGCAPSRRWARRCWSSSHCSETSPGLSDTGPALLKAGVGRRPSSQLSKWTSQEGARCPGWPAVHTGANISQSFCVSRSETLLSNLHANEIFQVVSESVRNQVEDYFSSTVQSLKMKQTLG